MKQKVIGVYDIGYEQVQVVLMEGRGGSFYFIPEKGSLSRIKIGVDYVKFEDVMNCLLHEAFEFVLARNNGRFNPSEDMGRDHSAYIFVFNHPVFSDCCAKVAELITAAGPDIEKAWKIWRKKKIKCPSPSKM